MAGDSMTSEVIEDEKQFYSKAKTYWKEVPPTVDGMLGGYGHISSIDINSSRKFLQRFLRVGRSGVLSRRRGCGAGGTARLRGAPPFHVHCRVSGHPSVSTTQAWKSRVGRGQLLFCAQVTRQEPAAMLATPGGQNRVVFLSPVGLARSETSALLPCPWRLGCSAEHRL